MCRHSVHDGFDQQCAVIAGYAIQRGSYDGKRSQAKQRRRQFESIGLIRFLKLFLCVFRQSVQRFLNAQDHAQYIADRDGCEEQQDLFAMLQQSAVGGDPDQMHAHHHG